MAMKLTSTELRRLATAKRDVPGELVTQIKHAGLPLPITEHKFAKVAMGRLWRFDICWPELMIAVECDGGTWSKSRHTTGTGFAEDCIKTNSATVLGWRVLRFTTEMVDDGSALATIEATLRRENA